MSANCKKFVNLLSCKEATKHEDGEGISWRSSLSGNPVRFVWLPRLRGYIPRPTTRENARQ
jgi:hypothetical protein